MKQGYFNTADSAHLYYEVRGSGRPLVLVHGWQCSHLFWQRNVDELAKDFTVVTLDLRGHGNSSKGLHGITIKQFAARARQFVQRAARHYHQAVCLRRVRFNQLP